MFVGYRYLPNGDDCTRSGYTFAGWASTDEPTTLVALPSLVDPTDDQQRMFLATNASLIAMWQLDPITDPTVFANFLCGPCTNAWLIFTLPTDADDFDVLVDDVPATCTQHGSIGDTTLCEIASLTPDAITVAVTPRNADTTARSTTTTFVLRS